MGAPAAPGQKDGHGHGHSMSWKEMKAQLYKLKDVQLCPDPDTLVFFMLAVIFMTVSASVTLLTCTTMELKTIGGIIAFMLVMLSCGISAYDIHEHFTHWQKPYMQRFCVRILLMVPIYGIQSWCALVFHQKAFILESCREMYEAWVVYSFVYLLIAFLGGPDKHMQEENVIEILKTKPADRGHHVGGMQACLKPWMMGREFLIKCKVGAQQYVLLRVFCTAVAIITWAFGVYGEGELDPKKGYFWVTLVVNFSQLWALYVLVFFYHALREDLAPVKPLGKFLTVKGVVFFAWWQSVGINAGLSMHIVEPESEMTTTEFSAFANDWIMCCEMFIAAVAFHYAYSYRDFYRYDRQQNLGIVAAAATYMSAINATANANDYIQEIEAAGAAMTAAVGPPRGELVFKLYKEEVNMKQRLTVTIVEARGLRESSLGGHSEPFCILMLIDEDSQPLTKMPGYRKSTKTVPRTVNPNWSEQLTFGGAECDLTGVWGVAINIRSKRSLARRFRLSTPLLPPPLRFAGHDLPFPSVARSHPPHTRPPASPPGPFPQRDARLGTVLAGIQKLELGVPITIKLSLDNDPPKVVSTEPPHKAGNVQTPVDQLVIAFDEEIKPGRGFVHVRLADAPEVPVASANVRHSENVIVKDRKIIVRLPPGAVAEAGALYYVTIDRGAFTDEADNDFEGYLDGSRWSFRTHGEFREKLKHMATSIAMPLLGRITSADSSHGANAASASAASGHAKSNGSQSGLVQLTSGGAGGGAGASEQPGSARAGIAGAGGSSASLSGGAAAGNATPPPSPHRPPTALTSPSAHPPLASPTTSYLPPPPPPQRQPSPPSLQPPATVVMEEPVRAAPAALPAAPKPPAPAPEPPAPAPEPPAPAPEPPAPAPEPPAPAPEPPAPAPPAHEPAPPPAAAPPPPPPQAPVAEEPPAAPPPPVEAPAAPEPAAPAQLPKEEDEEAAPQAPATSASEAPAAAPSSPDQQQE